MSQEYKILLYYKYVDIENPEEVTQEHKDMCDSLGLKGRVLIAKEGINGTVSGTEEQTNAYIDYMEKHPLFSDITYKVDDATEHVFPRMRVRYRPELVTLRLENDIDPRVTTGQHLNPKEWLEALQSEDTVVIDARNDYEYDLGHFRGAIKPDINTFKELPQWIKDNKTQFEGKKILTYCTGGVRCEKFSGWLVEEGFHDVAQLDGGIVTYGKDPEVQGELWDGQCYVFDERISVPINQKETVVVGKDYFSGEPCERYVNCANPECNKKILTSEENEHKYMRSCSHECRVHPRNRYIAQHELTEEEVKERMEAIKGEVTI